MNRFELTIWYLFETKGVDSATLSSSVCILSNICNNPFYTDFTQKKEVKAENVRVYLTLKVLLDSFDWRASEASPGLDVTKNATRRKIQFHIKLY